MSVKNNLSENNHEDNTASRYKFCNKAEARLMTVLFSNELTSSIRLAQHVIDGEKPRRNISFSKVKEFQTNLETARASEALKHHGRFFVCLVSSASTSNDGHLTAKQIERMIVNYHCSTTAVYNEWRRWLKSHHFDLPNQWRESNKLRQLLCHYSSLLLLVLILAGIVLGSLTPSP